jgi:hypothetical protein
MLGFGRRSYARRARVQNSPPFVPTSLPGVILWLRADRGIVPNGTTVSGWNDQSGHGNNVTQATAANQPTFLNNALGGKPGLRFNGTSSQMSFAGALSVGGNQTAQASYAAVFVNNQTAGTGSVISANGVRLLNILGGTWAYYSQQTGNGAVSALANATPYALIATQITTSNIPTYTNGTLVTLSNILAGVGDNPSTIGANGSGANNQFGQIDLCELIVSTTAWTTAQVNQLRAYITNRYGFAA